MAQRQKDLPLGTDRTHVRTLSIACCEEGMSSKRAGQALRVLRQEVKDWFARAGGYLRSLKRGRRSWVAVDTRLIHLPGGDGWLYDGVDLEGGEVVTVMVWTDLLAYSSTHRPRHLTTLRITYSTGLNGPP
jgi:hypothetical protein